MKKKQKVVFVSLISILLIVALGFGVYFIFFNKEEITKLKSEPLKQEISGLFEKTYYVNKNGDSTSQTSQTSVKNKNLNFSLLSNVVYAEEENTLAGEVANCNNEILNIYNNVYTELSSQVDPTGLINLTELNKRGLSSEMLRYNKLF